MSDDGERLQLDASSTPLLNLAVLQRIDPRVVSIVTSASHVAIYSFDSALQQWEKRNIEGALFITERDDDPQHRIVVLNRTSTTNLVQDVALTLQIQPKKPYLMLRDSAHPEVGIYGIWFQNDAELKRITHALARLMKGLKQLTSESADTAAQSGAAAGRALLSMLQQQAPPPAPVVSQSSAAVISTQASHKPLAGPSGDLAPAAAALFSSYAASRAGGGVPGTAVAVAASPAGAASSASAPGALTRRQLQTVLLDLLQDDGFIDVLHSRYLQVLQRSGPTMRG